MRRHTLAHNYVGDLGKFAIADQRQSGARKLVLEASGLKYGEYQERLHAVFEF